MFKSLEIYSNILWNRCLLRSENSSPNCSGSKGLKELNFHHSRIRLRFSIIYTSSYIHWKFQRNLTSKEMYHPIATFSFITKLFLKRLITMHKLRITVSVPSNSIRWKHTLETKFLGGIKDLFNVLLYLRAIFLSNIF